MKSGKMAVRRAPCGNAIKESRLANYSLMDLVRRDWNTPKSKSSPYFYTDGNMRPVMVDDNGNTVYKLVGENYNNITDGK